MAVTAADISKLRKSTGAGMMDCKNALVETDNDFDKAVDVIRKKGKAIANKRADRDASEGAVLASISDDGKKGAIVVLNCETDFVAKNDDFVKLTQSFLDVAIQNSPENLEALKACSLNGKVIGDIVEEQMGVIGEKLDISYYEKIEAEQVISYIHPGNKLATIVGFSKTVSDVQIAKDVAMQAAAMDPVAVDKDDIAQDVIDKELEIGREQAKQEGKPDNLLDKIAQGKLGKFYKERTLMNQAFIKDAKMTVKQYLSEADKEIKVTGFKRFSLTS